MLSWWVGGLGFSQCGGLQAADGRCSRRLVRDGWPAGGANQLLCAGLGLRCASNNSQAWASAGSMPTRLARLPARLAPTPACPLLVSPSHPTSHPPPGVWHRRQRPAPQPGPVVAGAEGTPGGCGARAQACRGCSQLITTAHVCCTALAAPNASELISPCLDLPSQAVIILLTLLHLNVKVGAC